MPILLILLFLTAHFAQNFASKFGQGLDIAQVHSNEWACGAVLKVMPGGMQKYFKPTILDFRKSSLR